MLTSELKNYLEGNDCNIDRDVLLKELKQLDKLNIESLDESLSLSSGVCPTCGRKL